MTMTDINRGPYHAIIEKQARARQAITGESFARAFTAIYEAPESAALRDGARLDHLSKQHDAMHGTKLSLTPAAKAAAYDPLRKAAEMAEHLGPAHARLHSMAVDHQRAHPGMSYQSAYGYLYNKPENTALREKIKSEHMQATMSGYGNGLDKAPPPDPSQDYASPGSANYELHSLVVARMKREPKLSYQQAWTREYLHEDNRALKDRVTAEGVLHMQHLAPAPAFPRYTSPGHANTASNIGRSGAKPTGYAGG
jgi:hypothetical protein